LSQVVYLFASGPSWCFLVIILLLSFCTWSEQPSTYIHCAVVGTTGSDLSGTIMHH
jgi:hypothetical protein